MDDREKSRQNARHLPPVVIPLVITKRPPPPPCGQAEFLSSSKAEPLITHAEGKNDVEESPATEA